MSDNSSKHHRRSIRLKEYDYSQPGGYFIACCSQHRVDYFGDIVEAEVELSRAGEIVLGCWEEIPKNFQHVELDQFIIMPNHIHGIIIIQESNNSRGLMNQTRSERDLRNLINRIPTEEDRIEKEKKEWILMKDSRQMLGKIVRFLKARSTRLIREESIPEFASQRNYYEHIIRNRRDYNNIQSYITNNPFRWQLARENSYGS